ncbi:MAG: sugar phosphate isomerase/epimerase [Planctomycetota bacterium]|nr:MAG: sugar phosphate isomerase/epimerase [Planctomycetota bacterium]
MRLGMINSAWAQAGRDTAWGIQKTAEIGFDCIDIFADPLDIDARERKLIRVECEKVNLPIISVACVAVGLIDPNPSVRRFHQERCRAYLDMTYEFGGENLLLVLGEYIWEQQVVTPAEQWATAIDELKKLGDHAGKLDLKIALELEPFKMSLLNTVDKMANFLDGVKHEAVQANIDISHCELSNTPAAGLETLRGRACHVHLSDCDGKIHGDLPPGRGVVDFVPYLKKIKELSLPGAVSLELEYSPDPSQIEAWVREAYTATAKLMDQVGMRPFKTR